MAKRQTQTVSKFNLRDARIVAREAMSADGTQPRARFRKEIVRAGVYHKGGTRIEIGSERLSHWFDTFARAKAAGVKVPLVNEHSSDPGDGRGYVESLSVDGDSLVAVIEAVGEDAIRQCERNEVSIGLADIKAGNGDAFSDAIQHVALTLHPVVGNMGDWKKLSRGKSTDAAEWLSNGDEYMEGYKKIAAALGVTVTDDMDEAGLLAAILAKAGAKPEIDDASKAKVEAMSRKVDELTAELSRAKSDGKAPEIDEDALEMAADAKLSRLDALVTAGKLTKAARDKWKPIIVGDAGNRPATMLSRKAAKFAGLEAPMADAILDAIEVNNPIELGEKTRNGRLMSREVPGDAPPDNSAALIEQAIKENHAQYATR